MINEVGKVMGDQNSKQKNARIETYQFIDIASFCYEFVLALHDILCSNYVM